MGLLKNALPGKTAIENKRVVAAMSNGRALFQQTHDPSFPCGQTLSLAGRL
jgi:hypothetical protein